MALLIVVFAAVMGTACDVHGTTSIAVEHSDDVIKYLWWALGLIGSIVALVSSGTAVWVVKTIIQHEKDIAAINARCAEREDESGGRG